VGNFLANYLDVDVNDITKRLRSSASWSADEVSAEDFHWMGDPLGSDVQTEGFDTYHGDFKKRSLDDCGCGGLH
jgi:alkaline phosphatase